MCNLGYEFVLFPALARQHYGFATFTHPNRVAGAHLSGARIFEAISPAAADDIDAKGIWAKEFNANTFHNFLSRMVKILS
jgi:hypothetical protein